jgi:hypothetical protein
MMRHTATEALCQECPSFQFGENTPGNDRRGADREKMTIEKVGNRNAKCSEKERRREGTMRKCETTGL